MTNNTQKPTILLRNEYKPNEHRTALTPHHLSLLSKYYNFQVESSQCRIFSNEEYQEAGAEIVPEGSWVEFNEPNGYVLGLKELPDPKQVMHRNMGQEISPDTIETPFAIAQRHIMFAHCYKYQNDWKETMSRFRDGNGELLDLEFLQWDNGRRVAAFGRAAGFAGMAVGLLSYVAQQQQTGGDKVDIKLDWFKNNADLVNLTKEKLSQCKELPTVLVLGALGRCGGGAVEMARAAGIPEEKIIKWDLAETKAGGPFPDLLEKTNVLVNCIYVNGKIDPFISREMLKEFDEKKSRKLSMFVDVSCEMSQNNPFPINNQITTFSDPLRRIVQPSDGVPPLDCCAIDHLPAMIPRQSSEDFSQDLFDTLSRLHMVSTTRDMSELEKLATPPSTGEEDEDAKYKRVWYRAKVIFQKKLVELAEEEA